MSDQRVSNPYASPNQLERHGARVRRSASSRTPGSPGVPDPGLRLDVRRPARHRRRCLRRPVERRSCIEFAADNFFLLIIAQLALVVVISWGINRISATAALGLFFVYAASLGLTIGLIVAGVQGASVVTAFLSASAMFGAAAIYGA